MKVYILFFLTVLIVGSSCNSTLNRIFTKQTPHEAYANQVKDDPLAAQWLDASKKVLSTAQAIELPYQLAGFFHNDKPRALALSFKARQGERVNFELLKKPGYAFVLFADLYKKDGTDLSHLLAADTANALFGFNVEETTEYILRIQPGLYRTGEYNLSASVSSSLGFPVAGKKARTGSFWGDARDGGKRSHEGIDIFAAKRTPVIAAVDGYITRVAEGGIGGKTVWMRAADQDIHLYYAHLDKQLVSDGQSVKRGDTLGLVGNTGNAKFTPPHLHFGVYTSRGPVDPLPFVNKNVKTAPAVMPGNFENQLVIKKSRLIKDDRLKPGSVLVPLAITKNGYIGEMSDGSLVQIPVNAVTAKRETSSTSTKKVNSKETGS